MRENLAYLIERRRTNANALAVATGVPQPTIHRILTGESLDPRTATLSRLAAYFGVSVSDLRERNFVTENLPTPQTNVITASGGSRRVPLLRYSEVKRGITEGTLGSLQASEFLMTDQELSPSAFAVELTNDSMAPDFRPGDRIVCDPAIRPAPGDFILAAHGNETVFGKFRPRQDGSFELVPLNTDYPTLLLDASAVLATMAEHRRYRRR